MMKRRLRPETTVFLTIFCINLVAYFLRGIGLLTFLPGGFMWALIFATIGAGVYSGIQGTRR
jgi:hypothetical protein